MCARADGVVRDGRWMQVQVIRQQPIHDLHLQGKFTKGARSRRTPHDNPQPSTLHYYYCRIHCIICVWLRTAAAGCDGSWFTGFFNGSLLMGGCHMLSTSPVFAGVHAE